MTVSQTCPVPECDGTVNEGALVCPTCYFKLPRGSRELITKSQIGAKRAESESLKQYHEEQLEGYLAVGIKQIVGEYGLG